MTLRPCHLCTPCHLSPPVPPPQEAKQDKVVEFMTKVKQACLRYLV